MCGIFALLNDTNIIDANFIECAFDKGKCRGPEYSIMKNVSNNALFGFHRLAINGIDAVSNKPIELGEITLIANGEIYNYKELYKMLNIKPITNSDCEVIIHCYKAFGIEYTLQLLDGVFAFALLDKTNLYVARDPYGVRPLYTCNGQIHAFASTMSMLQPLATMYNLPIKQFTPGSYQVYNCTQRVNPKWGLIKDSSYSQITFSQLGEPLHFVSDYRAIFSNIRDYLTQAVFKRCSTTERPIACLLSGGLDSSLIAALVCKYCRMNNLPPVETYSIGLEGSEDLKYAKQVALFLNTRHTSVIMTKDEFVNAIPEVIYNIESYDTTTVRASIGNYLLAKFISNNSEAKVIFSGEGADELTGGYLYMTQAPNAVEFDNECKRLLKNIHFFDVIRCDKSISSNGLEPRTPFLDRTFTQYYLSIPMVTRFEGGRHPLFRLYKYCEKYLLRAAFDPMFSNEIILPEAILWRTKEAFSDGISSYKDSAYEVLQSHIDTLPLSNINYHFNPPMTKEQHYYRDLYESHFPNQGSAIPYFWMPRFVEASDPSARTLDVYEMQKPELCERSL